jgi:primosomal protein N' (replication factor Y)
MGTFLKMALPKKLRESQADWPQNIEHWALTDEGKLIDPNDLKRAPKQQQALMHFQKQSRLSTEEAYQLEINRPTLKSLSQKKIIEPITQSQRQTTYQALNWLPPHALNDGQIQAVQTITESKAMPTLLYGVTGSGKTLVYQYLIQAYLKTGGQALVMIPEIGLTPQSIERFNQAFPKQVA